MLVVSCYWLLVMGYLGLTHWSETGFFTEFTVCNEDFVKKPGFFVGVPNTNLMGRCIDLDPPRIPLNKGVGCE